MFVRQITDFITDLWLIFFSKPADLRNNISAWYQFGTNYPGAEDSNFGFRRKRSSRFEPYSIEIKRWRLIIVLLQSFQF